MSSRVGETVQYFKQIMIDMPPKMSTYDVTPRIKNISQCTKDYALFTTDSNSVSKEEFVVNKIECFPNACT